jgi:hypothetical protein
VLAHPTAVAADVHQMTVMEYTVDQGGGHDFVAQHLAPFL